MFQFIRPSGLSYVIGDTNLDGAVVVNESGADVDFRVEGVGQANALFVQGSDGNVGIGTGSPATALHVAGAITAGNSTSEFYDNDSTSKIFGTSGAAGDFNSEAGHLVLQPRSSVARDIIFGTGTPTVVERMRINSAGNVGIGTGSPSVDLQVQTDDLGTDWARSHTKIAAVGSDSFIAIVSTDAGTWGSGLSFKQVDETTYENAWGFVRQTNGDGSGDGALRLTYGTNANIESNDDVVTFATDGNVGIGTDTPVVALDIVGSSPQQIRLRTTETDASAKYGYLSTGHYTNAEEDFGVLCPYSDVSANVVRIGGGPGGLNAATEIQLYTAANNTTTTGTQQVTIDNSGSVGIGANSPNARLEIDGATDEGQHILELDQDDDDEPFVKFDGTSAADQTKSISTVNGDGTVEGPKNYSGTAGWAFEGMIRIDVNGTDYWMPYYSADTA